MTHSMTHSLIFYSPDGGAGTSAREPSVHPVQAAAHAYVGAFVDELARGGVAHVVLCPGSRSTPLALLAMDQKGLKVWTHIDERSAAFFALGLAKATDRPVALIATSGTAVANFLPAATEAFFGRVPLLFLTADRPPELRDVGSNQTIFQAGLFGPHVKWAVDMPVPEQGADLVAYARMAAARAIATATASPRGPVQLNFPLREPLIPLPAPEDRSEREQQLDRYRRAPFASPGAAQRLAARPDDDALAAGPSTTDAQPEPTIHVWRGQPTLSEDGLAALAQQLRLSRRTLLVAGPDTPQSAWEPLLQLAETLGAPLLADPLSGLRTTGHVTKELIDAYDVFLRFDPVVHAVPPTLVLRVGALPVSKPLQQYLHRHRGTPQIVVDEGGGWRDPMLTATHVVHAAPGPLCSALVDRMKGGSPGGSNPWPLVWRRLNDITRDELEKQLDGVTEPFEGLVFAGLADLALDELNVYVGNSMPVRDMDTFFPAVARAWRVYGNRGVSGIDGVVSSGLGVSAAAQAPTLLIIGDLSFYHDVNGLLAAARHGLNVTVLVIHNDGGGIFSFLPQARHDRHFEALFGTPTGLDFAPAVAMYGGEFVRAADKAQLQQLLAEKLSAAGLHVIEYVTDRADNAARHRAVVAAAGEEVTRQLGSIFRSAGGGP